VDYYTMNEYAKWSKNIEVVDFSYIGDDDRYYVDCSSCKYNWTVKFTNPNLWSLPRVWDVGTKTEVTWTQNATEMLFEQGPNSKYVIVDKVNPFEGAGDGGDGPSTRAKTLGIYDLIAWLLLLLFFLLILYLLMKWVKERFEREVP